MKEKKYEAFGNLVSSSGTYQDNREFTSKEKDPTGFHYFGARYYSGDIGRFLSPDPHTLLPGNLDLNNPQELNPYVYCLNDPLNLYDPDGRNSYAIYTMQLTIDYYYNEHLLEQYNFLYDGCPSCGPGDLARFFPPDNPFGYKFGIPCFVHDNAQATEGISWARANAIFGMALLKSVNEQTDDYLEFLAGYNLAAIYCAFGTFVGSQSYFFYAQRNLKYTTEKGKLIPKDRRRNKQKTQDNSAESSKSLLDYRTDFYKYEGFYFNQRTFDPKYDNAGSCENW